jgi:hypothetical protein
MLDKQIYLLIKAKRDKRMNVLYYMYKLNPELYEQIETTPFQENIFSNHIERSFHKICNKFFRNDKVRIMNHMCGYFVIWNIREKPTINGNYFAGVAKLLEMEDTNRVKYY